RSRVHRLPRDAAPQASGEAARLTPLRPLQAVPGRRETLPAIGGSEAVPKTPLDSHTHTKKLDRPACPQFLSNTYTSWHYDALPRPTGQAVTRFRRALAPEPGRKEAPAPR